MCLSICTPNRGRAGTRLTPPIHREYEAHETIYSISLLPMPYIHYDCCRFFGPLYRSTWAIQWVSMYR